MSQASTAPMAKASTSQKVKTAAKQRYLKRKARRYKILSKAKRASAPKNKQWHGVEERVNASDGSDSDGESDQDLGGATQAEDTGPAGPSTLLPTPQGEMSEQAQRELRKQEKRRKREDRQKRKLEPHPEPVQRQDEAEDLGTDVDMEARPLQEHDDDEPGPSTRTPTRSPSPLTAFPLPTEPQAPSAAVLARQGLPAGLENAVFIDQDERQAIENVQVEKRSGTVSLSERIRKRLSALGIAQLFAVQKAILPRLLCEELVTPSYYVPADILVSAPTGSGKTLAYAIPLIETLSARRILRLRGLIVLPTKELVVQVRELLEVLAKGTSLQIGAITGQQSFAQEQRSIVGDLTSTLYGGSSKIDILVATPGRLIDHLEKTPNFSLQHLRFLIIDEADRLLHQSFHGWLAQVNKYVNPPLHHPKVEPRIGDDVATPWLEALGITDNRSLYKSRPVVNCQKLLFSATLTRDPAKIAALNLRNPEYFVVQSSHQDKDVVQIGEHFSVPTELSERMIVLPSALKPINLLHLIHGLGVRNAIVFTKSLDAVHRLVSLIQFFEDAWIGEKVGAVAYTADASPGERKDAMARFVAGKVQLLVCTDVVARGIDLPSVDHVVSYDIPLDMRKYVHRIGRTARAGRSGTAWTLVEKQEALRFKGMLKAASHDDRVKKVKVKAADVEQYQGSYEIAMKRFRALYGRDEE